MRDGRSWATLTLTLALFTTLTSRGLAQDNDAVWVNDFNTDIIPHTDVVAIGAEVSESSLVVLRSR